MDFLPTISFYCGCGELLYTLSTNILAYEAEFQCPQCGQEYACQDSLIATVVPARREESHSSHIQHPSESL